MKNSIRKPLILPLGIALFSIASLHAQTKNWVGGSSTDWNTGSNWNASGVPGSGNSVTINTNSGNQPTLSSGSNATLGSGNLTVGSTSASGANTTLTIQGAMGLSDNNGVIGSGAGSGGHVFVTASGNWTNSGNLTIGSSGTGTLDVQFGARVSSASSSLGVNTSVIGSASVDGTNSHWSAGSTLDIGTNGMGYLRIANGGSVSDTTAYIGRGATGNGSVAVSGTNSTWAGAALNVGQNGKGHLSVSDGGLVTSNGFSVGNVSGSTGSVSVSNGTLTVSGSATIGSGANGTLTVSNGGLVNAAFSPGGLGLAQQSGSVGTLNIGDYAGGTTAGTLNAAAVAFGSGTGTINFNQTDSTTFSANITGNGTLNQRGNGTTKLSGANTYTGATTVSSGTLLVDGTNTVGSGTTGAFAVTGTGTLGGNGTINLSAANLGITVASGGSLAPGDNGAGVLTANLGSGVFDISEAVGGANTGALKFELGSLLSSDKIALTLGTLNIGSGVLNFNDFSFSALSGFTEGTYTLIDTNSLISGTLGSSLAGTVSGRSVAIAVSGDGKDLVANVGAVPEPSIGALLVLGSAAVAWIRGRKAGGRKSSTR